MPERPHGSCIGYRPSLKGCLVPHSGGATGDEMTASSRQQMRKIDMIVLIDVHMQTE